MPVLKSSKKQLRQNIKHRRRNFPVRSELKSSFKKALKYINDGNVEEAVKFLPAVYSIIDIACKKKIIHPNNAAHKKSRLARSLNELQAGGGKAVSAEGEKVEKEEKKLKKEKKKMEKEAKKVEKAEEVAEKTE